MSIYLTQNGVRDISGLDEDQQVMFLVQNPDAVEATPEDLRIRGYARPNSEIEQEQDDVNEILIEARNRKFAEKKFGVYSNKDGFRSGGLGDKVSRDSFDTDQEWYEYQVWNGDIKEPDKSLDEQIQKRVRQNDLDVDPDSSHLFYNQNNDNSFVSKFLSNDKLRKAFSIPPLLVGGNPFTTTCIYSLIHYLERAHGVYFAMGGTGKIVLELTKLLESIGVSVRLNTTIEKIKIDNSKIYELIDSHGKVHKADVYVSNMDPLHLYKNIINEKINPSIFFKKNFSKTSMGLFVLFFGTKKRYENVQHHTIIFGKEYKRLLKKIFKGNELPDDISIYLHRPTATDKSFAPKNCDSFSVVVWRKVYRRVIFVILLVGTPPEKEEDINPSISKSLGSTLETILQNAA